MKDRSAQCREVRERIVLLTDKELPKAESEGLLEYLEECVEARQCDECRYTIDKLQRLKSLIAASKKPPLPSGLTDAIRATLDGEKPEPGESSGGPGAKT